MAKPKSAREVAAYLKKTMSPKDFAAAKELHIDKQIMEKARAHWKKVAKAPMAKKAVAKRTVGKALGKAIPGGAAVLTAAEIVKMVKNRKAKPIKGKSCGPGKTKVTTGGKTYCVSGKKKFKAGKPVKDPISKR